MHVMCVRVDCWDDLYEIHSWSNVLCVRRGDIWHKVAKHKYAVTKAQAEDAIVNRFKNTLDNTTLHMKLPIPNVCT